MVCRNCGKYNEDWMQFCSECGTKLEKELPPLPQDNQEQYNTALLNVNQSNLSNNNSLQEKHDESGENVNKNSKPPKKKGLIIAIVAIVLVLALCGGGFAFLSYNDIELSDVFSGNVESGSKDDDNKKDDDDKKDKKDDDDEEDADEDDEELMPSCLEWEEEEVEDYFEDIDCKITFEYEYSSDVEEGCVVSQTLEEGEEITEDTEITFVISLGAMECPEEYSQKIVVTGKSNSTSATMELFTWENGEWVSQYSCAATVGKNGIGSNYGEGKGITPLGVYKLGVLLTAGKQTNETWPYKKVTTDTGIVDDTSSSYYNTIVSISSMPSYVSCDPIGDTIINGNTDKCMYIEHNGNGLSSNGVVSGKGSAITICGKQGTLYATAGCIDISSSDFNVILSLLDYNLNPHIVIEVH